MPDFSVTSITKDVAYCCGCALIPIIVLGFVFTLVFRQQNGIGELSNGAPDSIATSTATSTGGVPPNASNCNGTYKLNNPIGNFGDPECNFNREDLARTLKQIDPVNADFWYIKVIKCESGYNPNAYASHESIGTPDKAGAWGLFQMGRGKNGHYDHGDVVWHQQVTNAVAYNKKLNGSFRYWACAKSQWR